MPITRFHCLRHPGESRPGILSGTLVSCALLSLAIILSGCGSGAGSGSGEQTLQAVEITVQPGNETVPVGQIATFTVTASGASPIQYQWSENGTPISGAVGASYTVPDVIAGDNGAVFTVAVSNSVNTVGSNAAVLTVGPRSPQNGDLRFQQVDAPSMDTGSTAVIQTANMPDNGEISFTNATGSPLELDYGACVPDVPYDCSWGFWITDLPTGQSGLTVFYKGGQYDNFGSDISAIAATNTVVTSLDLQPANGAYAVSWMQSSKASGFDMKLETAAPNSLQTTVTRDGAQSRVITAVSFDASGQVSLLSYGWQSDTSIYDASVAVVAPQDVAQAASDLAAEGYIITAFGGDLTNGFVLVGTKVHGDTLPRPILAFTQDSSAAPGSNDTGYAPVGLVDYAYNAYTSLYEK